MKKITSCAMTLVVCCSVVLFANNAHAALYKADAQGGIRAQDNKYMSMPKKTTVIIVKGDYLPLVDVTVTKGEHNIKSKTAIKKQQDASFAIIEKLLFPSNGFYNLPPNYKKITIAGKSEVTKEQATAFIKMYNNNFPISATPGQIVDYYYREAGREGIKWDIALCQALLETGFFTFGGTVVPEQNNYCGLGTTNATTRGVYFLTPLEGVRAHIQHLMAYSVLASPKTKIIDPRYYLVHNGKKKTGVFTYWSQLNGKWATGSKYSEKIIDIHEKMKQVIAVSGSEIW
ncbi:MAG: glucosaminidase domain-containing protein [Acidaminococcaceae bacterium]